MQEKLICETSDGANCILNEGFYVYFLPCITSFFKGNNRILQGDLLIQKQGYVIQNFGKIKARGSSIQLQELFEIKQTLTNSCATPLQSGGNAKTLLNICSQLESYIPQRKLSLHSTV
jgi:hypothetical protein